MLVLNHAVNPDSVGMTTTCKSHASTPNSKGEFIVGARHLHSSSTYIMHKRGLTHGRWQKHQKVEVKVHRELNNRNPQSIRIQSCSTPSEKNLGSHRKSSLVLYIKEDRGEQAIVELVSQVGMGNRDDSHES